MKYLKTKLSSDRLRILKPYVFGFEDYSFCNDYYNNYLLSESNLGLHKK